jgi:hypothetical protein
VDPVPGWLQILAAVGDAVGGIATALALWFAVRTVNTWAAQRRHEKRSEVAEQVLLVVRASCLHLHHWCLVLAMETTQQRGAAAAALDGVRSAVAFGRAGAEDLQDAVQSMRWRTSIHLKPDEQQLLADAEGLLVQARLDADHWVKKHQELDRDDVHRTFVALSGQADELRRSADVKLVPVVRFEHATAHAGRNA